MVAPDGVHYTYKAPDGPLHLVDAAHLSDRAIANPTDPSPIGYTAAGVWLAEGPGSGLWLLDARRDLGRQFIGATWLGARHGVTQFGLRSFKTLHDWALLGLGRSRPRRE